MKTSARNQFAGKVSEIKPGAVNAEVLLELSGGDRITAIITIDSLKSLGLKKGSDACALIKAGWVLITKENNLRTSARNNLKGKITKIIPGKVNTEVVLKLSGGNTLTSMITNESATTLGLAEGDDATAFFKASSVIIGVV